MIKKLKFKIDKIKNISKYELNDTKSLMNSIEKLIKDIIQNNPNISSEMIIDTINDKVNGLLFDLRNPTKSDFYFFKTLQNLINHPQLITDTINKMDTSFLNSEPPEYYLYTSNIQKNYQTVLKNSLYILYDNLSKNGKEKILAKDFSSTELLLLQNQIKQLLENHYENNFNSTIKDGYIERIVNYAKMLDFIGVLQQNTFSNNRRFKKANLPFLCFHYKKNPKDELKRPCITDLKNREFVKNFSIDELIALSTFYSNRTAKAIKLYNYCLYILYKSNIIPKYLEDENYSFNLSDNDIINLITQYQIHSIDAKNFLDNKAKNITDNEYEITDDTVYNEYDNHFIQKAINYYSHDYQPEYSKILPEYEHDFLEDLNKTILFEASSYNTYTAKNQSLEALLFILIEKKKEINWGIVLNDHSHGLPNQNKNNDLLLCVDMKEFNMPLSIHCSKAQVLEFLINLTGKPYIPVYKGNNDIFIDGKLISTQIYMKLSKDQRKSLRQEAENISADQSIFYKFIKHLQWMSHPKRRPEFIDEQNLICDLKTGFLYDEDDLKKEEQK